MNTPQDRTVENFKKQYFFTVFSFSYDEKFVDSVGRHTPAGKQKSRTA